MKLGEVRRKHGDLYGAIRAYQQLPRLDPQRKLGYAALFEAVALRDEALHAITPSRAEPLRRASSTPRSTTPKRCARWPAACSRAGYARAYELPMARSLRLAPLPDEALEHAAAAAVRASAAAGRRCSISSTCSIRRSDPTCSASRARAQLRGNAPVL